MRKILLMCCCLMLCGCRAQAIPEAIKKELETKSLTLIEYIQHDEFDKVVEELSLFYKNQITESYLRSEFEKLPDYGAYQGIDKVNIIRIEDGYQVFVFVNFEKYKAEYSFSYLQNGKLIGIFRK